MKRLSTIIAASALAVAVAAPLTGFTQPANAAGIMTGPGHSMSATSLTGIPVYNDQHQKIGTIESVMVTPNAAEPVVVLSVGDFLGTGPKMVGVPLGHLRLQGTTAMTMPGATREMLQNLPGYSITGG